MASMVLSSGVEISKDAFHHSLKRIINQVYKLLPLRQEGRDWQKPLATLIEEISGMKRLVIGQDDLFFLILCKMEGLFSLNGREDMMTYRRIIFESLNLLNELDRNVSN